MIFGSPLFFGVAESLDLNNTARDSPIPYYFAPFLLSFLILISAVLILKISKKCLIGQESIGAAEVEDMIRSEDLSGLESNSSADIREKSEIDPRTEKIRIDPSRIFRDLLILVFISVFWVPGQTVKTQ